MHSIATLIFSTASEEARRPLLTPLSPSQSDTNGFKRGVCCRTKTRVGEQAFRKRTAMKIARNSRPSSLAHTHSGTTSKDAPASLPLVYPNSTTRGRGNVPTLTLTRRVFHLLPRSLSAGGNLPGTKQLVPSIDDGGQAQRRNSTR